MKQIPESHLKNHPQGSKVYKIEGVKWLKLVEASVGKDLTKVRQHCNDINRQNRECNSGDRSECSRVRVKACDKDDGHYYEIEMNLRQFDIVHVQLYCTLSRAILCPDIQLFKISSNFCICLEHRRFTRRCFVEDVHDHASKDWYENIDDYIKHWKPVLAVEAATAAVSQNEGYVLKSHPMKWTKEDGEIIKGTPAQQEPSMPREIKFDMGDLACVRIPQYEDKSEKGEATKQPRNIWVGHGDLQLDVEEKSVTKKGKVELIINNMASDMPEKFLDGDSHPCDLEIICQPVPFR